mmetsp:Transcript_27298/g.76211  ORF Transcript_27298/g.76211 Transcript_27298/m.76211 type:complete len:224 (-) Transcript_27298:167-838(-)
MEGCEGKLRGCDAVCIDVDSTVLQIEAIDEYAKFLNKGEEVAELTRSAMQGGVKFQDALKARLEVMAPTQKNLDDFIASHDLPLTPGITELVCLLLKKGKDVYLVSGGFEEMIRPVAEKLGIPTENIRANTILFNQDGSYKSFDADRPTSRTGGKKEVVSQLISTNGYRQVVMIGDGVTDLEAASEECLFIGFGGNQCRPKVQEKADWFVRSFDPLIAALLAE